MDIRARRAAQSDRASAFIGQHLLKGWTLLADNCPDEDCLGIPLMRAPGQKHMTCPACSTRVGDSPTAKPAATKDPLQITRREDSTPAELEEQQLEEEKEKNVEKDESEMIRVLEEKRRQRDEASAKIGNGLLRGWTLLNDVCPLCNSPLMRDKEKKMMCVVCGRPVATRAEIESMAGQMSTSVPPPAAAPARSSSPPTVEDASPRQGLKRSPPEEDSREAKRCKSTHIASGNDDDRPRRVLANTSTSVWNAMESFTSELERTSPCDTNTSIALLQAIKECGETLSVLKQLK